MCDSKRLTRAEIDTLADHIAVLSAQIDAASHELLTAIRRFDEAGGWAAQGAKSCAHWLSWRIGVGLVAAREKVRVAHALGSLPRIDGALSRGELSYAKVRAMTRVADPANEELLLGMAKGATGAQLERVCAGFRRVSRGPQVDEERRFVRRRHMPDGMVRIEMRLLPDEAERVWQALGETRRSLAGDDSAEAPTLADAAVVMAERSLAAPAPSGAARRRQLFVHLREERLADHSGWRAELHDGTPLSGQSLLRLACDSGLVVAKTDDRGQPLDIGRLRRSWSPALMRALVLRDRRCRFPGCTQSAFLEAHHVVHWSHGGETSLENGALLCHGHHVAVHEAGFVVEHRDGTLLFRDPTGRPIPAHPEPPPPGAPPPRDLSPRINLPAWDGRPLDLHAAVGALCFRQPSHWW